MLIKRLNPVQTQLDDAEPKLNAGTGTGAGTGSGHRVLEQRKTQDAMEATHVAADDINAFFWQNGEPRITPGIAPASQVAFTQPDTFFEEIPPYPHSCV